MKIRLYKYHGTGNDFILIDNRQDQFPGGEELIASMCNRHLGIGADGLILLNNSDRNDFAMRYFNADGREGSMCGNGGRCIAAFARKLGIIADYGVFSGIDGIHEAEILGEEPPLTHVKISLKPVRRIEKSGSELILDTGSPHLVLFRERIEDVNVYEEGRKLRHDSRFPEGINVNFVEVIPPAGLKIATFERGVEDETLSCGTGVTAAGIAAYFSNRIKEKRVSVSTRGGKLTVSFDTGNKGFENIYLQGPANFVFKGEYEV